MSYIIIVTIIRNEFMSIIDEIKNRSNIIDVIGRQVQLKKTGSNHKGLCPFHSEKTPSFVVSEDKQIFTCFGCGATGDIIEFTKKYYNLDFQGAIEQLANEYGIELRDAGFTGEGEKQLLYDINREAATFFFRRFASKPNKAESYMISRGFDPKILHKFGVGYADEEWQSLYDFLKAKKYNEDVLLSLGLIAQSKGKYYDKYRDRIIFPIINTRGKIIGFGGRIIGNGMPKYLNSQESIVFQKKNNLYGLYLTRQDINREDCAILVEGYMDVISLYQRGVRNVSASLGTALTEGQARMLKRYTNNIVLAYDADEAGQKAASRGMEVLHRSGCKVKILQMPKGKDPDDYIKENGKEAFGELVKDALTYMDYKLMGIKSKVDINTTEGSVAFLKEAAIALKKLSPVESESYIKKIARETGISEGAFRFEIFGGTNEISARDRTGSLEKDKNKTGSCTILEQNLIRLMLLKSSYVPLIEPYGESFETASCYRIYELIRALYKPDEEIDIYQIKDNLDDEAGGVLERIIENIQFADRDKQVFEECIAHIADVNRAKREEELIKILSILDDERDSDKILELSKELMDIQKERYKVTGDEL